ncbi:MAG: metal ABC transporter substrate-binding protein [Acidimicrobiia bacterium]
MRKAGGLLLLVIIGACAAAPSDPIPSGGLRVVATTGILGDVAWAIAGDSATVEVLIPGGVDPHDYRASSQQVASLHAADLVVSNGLGLEEGLTDVLAGAADDGANLLVVAPALDPVPFGEGTLDPHVWMDPVRMATAARLISAALATVDNSSDWAAGADAYAAELDAADRRIESILAEVTRRKLVTNHDAFGYFAHRYDFEVVGVVIPGGSTLANPSSSELAALVETIRSEGVPAIFAETTQPALLVEAVAEEVGSHVAVVQLYSGSLGEPGSGADTLVGMLLTNAQRIAAALS